jgi:hypothetical protein
MGTLWLPRAPVVPGISCRWLTVPSQAPNKALASILGKSNLRFAGMSISVNISVDGLNLSVPATRQVRVAALHPAHHPAAALVPSPTVHLCSAHNPAQS